MQAEHEFRVGDIVRYRKPGPGEEAARLVVLEWNGDRGFLEHLNTGLPIPPVEMLHIDDIEAVDVANGRCV